MLKLRPANAASRITASSVGSRPQFLTCQIDTCKNEFRESNIACGLSKSSFDLLRRSISEEIVHNGWSFGWTIGFIVLFYVVD